MRDISTHWVLKAPLCDSRSAHIGNQTSGRQVGFIHTTRDQKLLTRNMRGLWFLGVGGNGVPGENLPRRVWNRQTKFTYNHWLAALVKGKCSSTKPTRLAME